MSNICNINQKVDQEVYGENYDRIFKKENLIKTKEELEKYDTVMFAYEQYLRKPIDTE